LERVPHALRHLPAPGGDERVTTWRPLVRPPARRLSRAVGAAGGATRDVRARAAPRCVRARVQGAARARRDPGRGAASVRAESAVAADALPPGRGVGI